MLRMMIKDNLKMRWKCEARADHLDDEICELMAEAGCERVKIGFESGSNRILPGYTTCSRLSSSNSFVRFSTHSSRSSSM